MAESTTATSPTDNASSPLTGLSSYDGAVVLENSYEAIESMDHRILSMPRSSIDSYHESNSVVRSFPEKEMGAAGSRYGYSVQAIDAHDPADLTRSQNGIRVNGPKPAGPSRLSKPHTPKKEKKGSFKNTLRRMFGKKPKTRISMPTPVATRQVIRAYSGTVMRLLSV